MKKLAIQWFIEQHRDWEKILSEKPYCFQISKDIFAGKNLVLIKYNQIDTDWNAGPITREARGIILDEDTNEVVSYAFNKFFNEREIYADDLDAKSMVSTTKIDGSIVKIRKFEDGQILISTNGTINADNAPVPEQIGCPFKSFGDIVKHVLVEKFGSLDRFSELLSTNYTYIFELVSPYTRVVVPFHECNMYLIGCRDIRPENDFKEVFFKDCELAKHFDTPDILDFSTIEDCLKYAQTLDWTNEGYVVMDKDFNRVKVKNQHWLAVHHLCENHTMSYNRAVEIVRANEVDEVLAYFPEFKDALMNVKGKYNEYVNSLENNFATLKTWLNSNGYDRQPWWIRSGGQKRKELAMFVMPLFKKTSGFAFAYVDEKVKSVEEWINGMPAKNLVIALGFKEH